MAAVAEIAGLTPQPSQRPLTALRGRRLKRAIDVAGAGAGLVLVSPVMAAAAIAIKREDDGPVLFRQERIGVNGRPFTIVKFRTMVVDAERLGLGLSVAHDDDRITRVGRVLRDTSVDELPQLINVLRGDMSLVGPRPTVRSQVDRYTPFQWRRLEVSPGIAGWAQINGRNSLSWRRRIELDVWYVDHRSTWLDIKILLRTVVALLRRAGMYGPTGVNPDLESD